MPDPDHNPDRQRVADLLGRQPQGDFDVVVRDDNGDPVVIRNSPLLADGTPMPTRYWLVSAAETRRIGTLEAGGGVNAAEAAVDPAELADAHRRYAAERDAAIDPNHDGPRPSGGVGGTRTGVKCLHSHWAWHLAGGDDPVGKWIEEALAESPPPAPTVEQRVTEQTVIEQTVIELGDETTMVHHQHGAFKLGWGAKNLAGRWLEDDDPPQPEELTNALGAVDDDLDDLDREFGPIMRPVTLSGAPVAAIARLETGTSNLPSEHTVGRSDLEEIFRLAATETRAERRQNPGLADGDEGVVVSALCIALAVVRRYRLTEVRLSGLR